MIKVNRKAFLEILNESRRFADPKSTMPILAMVLLQVDSTGADAGTLRITATDLNNTRHDRIACETTQAQDFEAICTDAKKLAEVVKALPGEKIELASLVDVTSRTEKGKEVKVETRWLSLISGKSKFKLPALPARDYPKQANLQTLAWRSAPASTLRELIDATSFSISTDETRSHLAGALLEVDFDLKVLRMVTTDGHRLSKAERPLNSFSLMSGTAASPVPTGTACKQAGNKQSVLIPRRALAEVRRFLGKNDCEVDVAVAHGRGFFRLAGDFPIISVLLTDAAFPPYDQVIPRDAERSANVDSKTLTEALKCLLLVASEKTFGVRWSFRGAAADAQPTSGDEQTAFLTLSAENHDAGEASEELEVVGTRLSRLQELSEG